MAGLALRGRGIARNRGAAMDAQFVLLCLFFGRAFPAEEMADAAVDL
jgi:hypothetical protein